jgi:hypothetical protein
MPDAQENEMQKLKIVIEAAQQLANVSEQPVAIYQRRITQEIDYDVAGALQDTDRVLEIIHPSLADKRIQ